MKHIDKLLAKVTRAKKRNIVAFFGSEEEAQAAIEAYRQANPNDVGKFTAIIENLDDDDLDENGVGFGVQIHHYKNFLAKGVTDNDKAKADEAIDT